MASYVTYTFNTPEFDRAFKELYALSKRSLADFTNKKAYYITRTALYETPAVSKETIISELGTVTSRRVSIQGVKQTIYKTSNLTQARQHEAPLAALLVNKQRAKDGQVGLWGPAMEQAIGKFIRWRTKTKAYLRSGWLPALRILARSFKGGPSAPRTMGGAAVIKTEKGDAVPAKPGFHVVAVINNAAVQKDGSNTLAKIGGPALQRAFEKEGRSMMEEVARRLAEEYQKAGYHAVAR